MKRFSIFTRMVPVLMLISVSLHSLSQPFYPKYEFRGVWVATVNNIDWPSRPGLPVEVQQQEVIEILDLHQQHGMNAIIFQVRPCADAFYPSAIEPWSRYLTGIPGRPPYPFYDPLKFWIEECHKRNMELHAWLNPYRVAQNADEPLAYDHRIFSRPEWAIRYTNKLYFDPGIPGTRDYVTSVVCDIVRRYDVDGIHMDDYFYPYPDGTPFPDERSFAQYNRAFPPEEKVSWRRENVDILIKMISDSVKAIKPYVKFGISPFGVWRNSSDDPLGSATQAGVTNYDHLYADILKWMRYEWIDYVTPQIYWEIGHPRADFEVLCKWWNDNAQGCRLYIGMAPYKITPEPATPAWKNPAELPAQIKMLRKYPNISGSVFFSSKSFKRDLLGFQDSLKHQYYRYPALTPPLRWTSLIKPGPPADLKVSGRKVSWNAPAVVPGLRLPLSYLIYLNNSEERFDPGNSLKIIGHTRQNKAEFHRKGGKKKPYSVRVTTLDHLNNESDPAGPGKIKL